MRDKGSERERERQREIFLSAGHSPVTAALAGTPTGVVGIQEIEIPLMYPREKEQLRLEKLIQCGMFIMQMVTGDLVTMPL